jgi:hypothetical protein
LRLPAAKSQKRRTSRRHAAPRSGDGDDCRMEFPYGGNVHRALRVREILERHTEHLDRQGLRQLSAVLRIQAESVFCELRLYCLPRAAILAIHRGLNDDAGSIFVRGQRNLKVHVAVSSIHTRFLQEGTGDVKDALFAASPWSIGSHEGILRPTQNGIDADFFCGDVGDSDVLGKVTKISDVRLDREALTEILGIRLQSAVISSFAGAGGEP